jgi:hypothetical protein
MLLHGRVLAVIACFSGVAVCPQPPAGLGFRGLRAYAARSQRWLLFPLLPDVPCQFAMDSGSLAAPDRGGVTVVGIVTYSMIPAVFAPGHRVRVFLL